MRFNSQPSAGSSGEETISVSFCWIDKPAGYLARAAAWHHCYHLEKSFLKQSNAEENREMERERTLIVSFEHLACDMSVCKFPIC